MVATRLLLLAALVLPVFAAGCAADDGEPAEESGFTDSALSGTLANGSTAVTTARLNFREGPSTSDDIIKTLAVGTEVTIINGKAKNGFYEIEVDGQKGFVYGSYLKAGKKAVAAGDDDDDTPPKTGTGTGTGTGQIETCKASFYTSGQQTANGEKFNTNALTAAHKTLKFNTVVRVTNTKNNKSVDVRINDRGPFIAGRCIDLSRAGFATIADLDDGVVPVKVEVLK